MLILHFLLTWISYFKVKFCVIKDHAQASCSCFDLLMLVSEIMWYLRSCEKNTEKVVPFSKYSKLIFFWRNLIFRFIHYFKLYFNSNQNYFFGSHLLKNLNSSKQSMSERGFCLLCFAHGLNDPIINSYHKQSKSMSMVLNDTRI